MVSVQPGPVGGELGLTSSVHVAMIALACRATVASTPDPLRRAGVGVGPGSAVSRCPARGTSAPRARGVRRAALMRGQPAHPEVRVHDVRRLRAPALGRASAAKAGHVAQQVILGQRPGRPGRHVPHGHAGREAAPRRAGRGRSRRVNTVTSWPRRPSAAWRARRRARSGRQHRRRPARPAGWRAPKSCRSSRCPRFGPCRAGSPPGGTHCPVRPCKVP